MFWFGFATGGIVIGVLVALVMKNNPQKSATIITKAEDTANAASAKIQADIEKKQTPS